ncbi:hypothetical protein J7E29_16615 [Streptomyces sp. ISL-90]|nr:hypothetical protein [Streptomyces sp. ISL-90]
MFRSIIAETVNVVAAIPKPTPEMPPGFGNFETIMNWVMWISIGILIVAIIVAWVWFGASKNKGEGNDSAVWVGRVLISAIGISAAGTMVGAIGAFA